MSKTAVKPSLTGTRIKTRKRDEKEKYDPTSFRDNIIAGLKDCIKAEDKKVDLEKASAFLIKSGSVLDYRRYAEALFDVLLTGGILAPGGAILDENGDAPDADYCVFRTPLAVNEGGIELMRKFIDFTFSRVIRQYKYLEKSLDDEMKKVIKFAKGFTEEQREKLAVATFLLISGGLCTPACLVFIFNEHLVKDGIALSFSKRLFLTWLQNKDVNSLMSVLKKAEIDNRLLELFPINKRSLEAFVEYFKDDELKPVVDIQRNQSQRTATKDLKSKLKKHCDSAEQIKKCCKDVNLPADDMLEIIWTTLMKHVTWNKKDDMLGKQAADHIATYADAFKMYTKQGEDFNLKNEKKLIILAQEYCYDNMNFVKVFKYFMRQFYVSEVISEDAILRWHSLGGTFEEQTTKGASTFLSEMQKMVDWLKSAEEETSDEEEDEDDADEEE